MKIPWCWRCKMEVPILDEDEFRRIIGPTSRARLEPARVLAIE